jgi:hypothetical protein
MGERSDEKKKEELLLLVVLWSYILITCPVHVIIIIKK